MPNKSVFINTFGWLVGLLSATKYHFGPIYSSPELNILLGNLFAFAISHKKRYTLKLTKSELIANNIYQLTFAPDQLVNYLPGQYLEWSLPHQTPDSRGFRRYFTISSSPTEKDIQLTFKYFSISSSFKNSLLKLKTGDVISVSHIAGDFTPEVTTNNIVFIAGGIGITPFRSIVKYYCDKDIKRNIYLFYSSTNEADFAFKNIFQQAEKLIGLKTQYLVSSKNQKITTDSIKKINSYQSYTYFISGPDAMVRHYKKLLQSLGIKNIKTDYFPGF